MYIYIHRIHTHNDTHYSIPWARLHMRSLHPLGKTDVLAMRDIYSLLYIQINLNTSSSMWTNQGPQQEWRSGGLVAHQQDSSWLNLRGDLSHPAEQTAETRVQTLSIRLSSELTHGLMRSGRAGTGKLSQNAQPWWKSAGTDSPGKTQVTVGKSHCEKMSGETILWHVKILFFFKQHAVESFLCPADTFKFTIVAQTLYWMGSHEKTWWYLSKLLLVFWETMTIYREINTVRVQKCPSNNKL